MPAWTCATGAVVTGPETPGSGRGFGGVQGPLPVQVTTCSPSGLGGYCPSWAATTAPAAEPICAGMASAPWTSLVA